MIRHLIVFNVCDGITHEQCLAMAALGKQVLGAIPGVMRVEFGVAIASQPRYRYNFTIDIESEEALRDYQVHPEHVAFADTHFRPMAPDRITTDYALA